MRKKSTKNKERSTHLDCDIYLLSSGVVFHCYCISVAPLLKFFALVTLRILLLLHPCVYWDGSWSLFLLYNLPFFLYRFMFYLVIYCNIETQST